MLLQLLTVTYSVFFLRGLFDSFRLVDLAGSGLVAMLILTRAQSRENPNASCKISSASS